MELIIDYNFNCRNVTIFSKYSAVGKRSIGPWSPVFRLAKCTNSIFDNRLKNEERKLNNGRLTTEEFLVKRHILPKVWTTIFNIDLPIFQRRNQN